jgi:hypothetical protein
MTNNPPAPEKAPTGYVLVTEGVVQEGDWIMNSFNEWEPALDAIGETVGALFAVLRPPTPQPSERERELERVLEKCRALLDDLWESYLHNTTTGTEIWESRKGDDVLRAVDALFMKQRGRHE